MAITVIDGTVHIRRGDSGTINVVVRNVNGQAYTLGEDDVLSLTVRERAEQYNDVLIAKESTTGVFSFSPEDTSDLDVGQYSFDVQLTRGDGTVDTIIPVAGDPRYSREENWGNFCIEAEVTIDG